MASRSAGLPGFLVPSPVVTCAFTAQATGGAVVVVIVALVLVARAVPSAHRGQVVIGPQKEGGRGVKRRHRR